MRRSRRGGYSGQEFGGSGEDSFVAVVVTKLTGALLFILLLTMVIMALLPKAIDLPSTARTDPNTSPLAIATSESLPEAIVGRPYTIALAATGGQGPLRWSVDGELPDGLVFNAATSQLQGTPRAGTTKPADLVLRVTDGATRASRVSRLVVYEPDHPLTTPSHWKPKLPPVPWRAWMEQGFGFLLLLLIHMVGMNALGGVERWSSREAADGKTTVDPQVVRHRFSVYRGMVRLTTLSALIALVAWLWLQRG
jgi:hypothetical protein